MPVRQITLDDSFYNQVKELERLHYETTTRERILALALNIASAPIETSVMNHYMEEYTKSYAQYEQQKNIFYNEVVSQYMEPSDVNWELNFESKTISFYAQ